MANYSEAQKKAINKYRSDKACINLVIQTELKEKFNSFAKQKGISLTQLICLAVEKYINSEQ